MNPSDDNYTAPRAGYQGKGHIVYEDISAFGLRQRLNRLRFACYNLASYIIWFLLGLLLMIMFKYWEMPTYGAASFGLLAILFLPYWVSLVIRRLHDLGRSGWWWLLMFVPILSAPYKMMMPGATTTMYLLILFWPLFYLYLVAGAGTPGMNRYGTPNPQNGVLVNVFGGLFWIFMVLNLLFNFAALALSFFAPEMLERLQDIDPRQLGDLEGFKEAMGRLLQR
ncbi:MAG: DUF805 domain-containing protein [Alcanivoracaceae bacterium]|jgi:uncharacterized membrane protein YhaH (DUF805 family)|nr:DUF805 domain-containing protein [Alcanivoracaceae bacterium]